MPTDLNEKAQKRFNELKSKLKLDLQKPIINEGITLTQEKLDQMTDPDEARQIMQHHADEAESAADIVDNTFAFIDSLKLPPELSLAIGYIISGNNTGNLEDLNRARLTIKEYLYSKMYKGFTDAKREETPNSKRT